MIKLVLLAEKFQNMQCTIHFYLLNEHFSEEYAEIHHGGEESELNLRYEWEDELHIKTEVDKILVHDYTEFPLQGEMPSGEAFVHDVQDMRLFEISSPNHNSTFVGCSESILDSYEIVEMSDRIVLKVYLKDYEPMANPIPGIYIAAQEFPKELII